MKSLRVLSFAGIAMVALGLFAGEAVQSDWSGGIDGGEPVRRWETEFRAVDGISWRALSGQLALSSVPLAVAVPHDVSSRAAGAIKVVAGDVNGDGRTDLVSAAYYADEVILYLQRDQELMGWDEQVMLSEFTHPVGLNLADVNGDGWVDILATASELPEIVWLENPGSATGQWRKRVLSSRLRAAHDLVAADLNGDGHLDLVAPLWEDDELRSWISDGGDPPFFDEQLVAGTVDYPTKVEAVDLDGDGDLDLASVGWLSENLLWWRNDGGTPLRWSPTEIDDGLVGVHWVASGDVDDDGRPDLVAAAMNPGFIWWWRNLDGPRLEWQRSTITTTLAGAVSAVLADLDGDGDLDVLGGGWSPTGGVSWFENRAAGASWQRRIVDAGFGETSSVHAADVDGDGDLDAVASSWSGGVVGWWELTDFAAEGELTSSVLQIGPVEEWQSWALSGRNLESGGVRLFARYGSDAADLGAWLTLTGADFEGLLEINRRYLQYRIELERLADGSSPVVESLRFDWFTSGPDPMRRGAGRHAP